MFITFLNNENGFKLAHKKSASFFYETILDSLKKKKKKSENLISPSKKKIFLITFIFHVDLSDLTSSAFLAIFS